MKRINSIVSEYVTNMCRPSHIILISGLSLILCSLSAAAFFFFSPTVSESEIALWLQRNLHILIDTILASLFVTISGALILDYSYKHDRT